MNEDNNKIQPNGQWDCQNVIIADADYIDHVAFNLIVNFERMLMRRIPPADIARWIDCIALDGGMRPVEQDGSAGEIASPLRGRREGASVVLIHDKNKTRLENFVPSNYAEELHEKAFQDHLGEFVISALPIEQQTTRDDFFLDILGTVCQQPAVQRIMVIPNAEEGPLYNDIRNLLRQVDDSKRITVFAMQPMPGGNFRQEILGYSLMNALGIHSEDLSSLE
ncbi:MAG: hypothetical protein IJJ68_05070 [Prevotella sp.]|nr:hypothetical protein [Prevotella sp.]